MDWQMNRARFDRSTLGRHTHDLVAIRVYADGVNVMTLQILYQAQSRSLLFDQKAATRTCRQPPAVVVPENGLFQVRILQPRPHDVQDEDGLSSDKQNNRGGIIGELAAAQSRVPADDELVAALRGGGVPVYLDPRPPDRVTDHRDGGLLILLRELPPAPRCLKLVERRLRLALRMQEI